MRKLNSLLFFLLFISVGVVAQEITITGKVTSPDDKPLQGVTVAATNAGNKLRTMTSEQGTFSIKVPADVKELVFTYTGMNPVTEKINGRRIIDVQMTASSAVMDQVVVTALGIKREV